MVKAINTMICIMLPITIVTCMCSREIVTIAYARGEFNANSVAMTSAALIGYALGFASSGVRDIILRGLYSFKNTKGPMITGFFAVGANIMFSIILSHFIGILGISIASSISLTVNFLINSQMLKKHIPDYKFRVHLPVLLKQLPSAAFTIATVLVVKHFVASNLLTFMISAVIGIGGYGLILMAMKIEEVNIIKEKALSKIGR